MIKILIVEDDLMCREGIKSFLDLCGYSLDVKYAISFDDAMGYLAETFEIVVCDYFLEATHLSNETGLVFLKKYCGKHGELNTDNDDQVIILYSGAKSEIPVGQGFYCVDRDNLTKELENKIALIAERQKEKPIIEKRVKIKEGNIMPRIPLTGLIPLVILAVGIIGSTAVSQFKIDSTKSDVIMHCSEDKIYKEKQTQKELQTAIALAEILTTLKSMNVSIDELKSEVRKHN